MKSGIIISSVGASIVAIALTSTAEAALVKFDYSGTCTGIGSGCGLVGLNVGDAVTGSFTIDDSFLPAVGSTTSVPNSNISSLSFTFGNQTFNTGDIAVTDSTIFDNPAGTARVINGAGDLADNSSSRLPLSGATDVFVVDLGNNNFTSASGSWTNTGVVPIPAALYLFGTGLLGLIGIARRKKAA